MISRFTTLRFHILNSFVHAAPRVTQVWPKILELSSRRRYGVPTLKEPLWPNTMVSVRELLHYDQWFIFRLISTFCSWSIMPSYSFIVTAPLSIAIIHDNPLWAQHLKMCIEPQIFRPHILLLHSPHDGFFRVDWIRLTWPDGMHTTAYFKILRLRDFQYR